MWELIMQADWKRVLNIGTEVVAACSLLHTVLPPWDWHPDFVEVGMAEFPVAQKSFYAVFHNRYYRFLIYLIGYVALNGRSTIWKFISVHNSEGPNANIPAIVHAANQQLAAEELSKTTTMSAEEPGK